MNSEGQILSSSNMSDTNQKTNQLLGLPLTPMEREKVLDIYGEAQESLIVIDSQVTILKYQQSGTTKM